MNKRLLSALIIISILLLSLSSCVIPGAAKKLDTPTIVLSEGGGIASWEPDLRASKYEVILNEIQSFVTIATTEVQLEDGDTIKIRAIGDGKYYSDSDWSNSVTYSAHIPPSGDGLGGTSSGGSGGTSGGGSGGTPGGVGEDGHLHRDDVSDGLCDVCGTAVIVVIDFYAINDLHGKFCDTNSQPGVDELSTYLKGKESSDDNVVVLSSGDMWQGSAESNLTYGKIMTEWMNEIGVVSMTLGNHEFDWGESYIKENLEVAEFPFLAINVYDNSTGKLADYCTPSVMIDEGGIQIGIIGAIGDCYSSISSDMVKGVHFKKNAELTALVKEEANRLRAAGADIIVYSLHDGAEKGYTGSVGSYYDTSLSNGYVDLVFEGHSHLPYTTKDSYGVYHIQGGGENYGISHAEIEYNIITGEVTVDEAEIVRSSTYGSLADDAETEAIEDKYQSIIDMAYTVIGTNKSYRDDAAVEQLVAELYYKAGVAKWGGKYDIAIGGGFLRTRNPYNLAAGQVTYADLISILPFNNSLVLCSIKGSYLKSRFMESTDDDYYVYPTTIGAIDANKTYYVVVDSYTANYTYNRLTVIEYYDESTYARDLLADYIRAGGLS